MFQNHIASSSSRKQVVHVEQVKKEEEEEVKPDKPNEPNEPNDIYELFFDGCSKGNPGPAGAGAVLYKNRKEIWADAWFVGKKETNNVAEYRGLIFGLREAINQNIQELIVKGDSMLVIKQMRGEYKVSHPNMLPLYQTADVLRKRFTNIRFEHVYRDNNQRADALSNEGLTKPVQLRV